MRLFIIISILSVPFQLFAQRPENDAELSNVWQAAIPSITHYAPEDYKAHVQNWCFAQDKNGIMYVGNTSGILEYDGVAWRLIKLPNGSPAKSLARSADNTIYVGAVRGLGYLQADSVGQMQFCSLLPHLDSVYRNFTDIWFTYTIGKAAYFISDHYIFKWFENDFKVWKAKEKFGFANLIKGQIYIDNADIGLMHLAGDSLKLIPGGDKFLNQPGGITSMLPYKNKTILMAHNVQGLFLYDGQRIVPFKKEGKNLLSETYIYGGTELPNGNCIFITSGNGCFIIDKEGRVKLWLSKERGLASDVIIGVFVDREGSLWLATENGIDRAEISSPFRILGLQSGLSEGADRVIYYNNRLYAATKNGLSYLTEISSDLEKKDFHFHQVNGMHQQTWDLLTHGKYLLAGNFNGTYQIDPANRIKQLIAENTYDLYASHIDTNRVYAGTTFGHLYALKFMNKQWQVEKPGLSIEGRIIRIEENDNGSLWLSTRYNGVYKLDWLPSNNSRSFDGEEYTLRHYDTVDGLPEISYNIVFHAQKKTFFSTQAGIYRFDSSARKFIADTTMMRHLDDSPGAENILKESSAGGMWITSGSNSKNSIYKYNQGIINEVDASKRFSDFVTYDIYEKNNLTFFSGPRGSLVYNRRLDQHHDVPYSVSIRRVTTNDDSLIFDGHVQHDMKRHLTSLPYKKNALRFSYALPSYDKSQANQYQYYLEGFDKGWSAWTTEAQRDFTNLPEGDYHFHVRGKNVYGQVGDEAVYAFTILPPWFRTWWAYLIYVVTGAGFITLIVSWRSNQLKKEKAVLENIVAERTQQLARQAEQLKEMDRQKSRFFANISHEFRTPLTLIKGPVEDVLHSSRQPLSREDALMIRNNANRLLRLVNQLLDLAKLDANKLKISPANGNINKFLRAIGSAFTSHAEQRNIDYKISLPDEDLLTNFDHDKMEKILYNLLSNAFKFTPDHGLIALDVAYENGQVVIAVTDNGVSIPATQLPHIFNRFYQTGDSLTKEQEGAGIGLALTKELVDLMGGEIQVESRFGEGSKFTVIIPMKKLPATGEKQEENGGFKKSFYLPESSANKEIEADQYKEDDKKDKPIVLIVEDNADMRGFIKKQLKKEYQIVQAAHGKLGLEQARSTIPDLIITDLMMPQMDGMELCEQLKTDERTSHIPVIMLTARAGQEQKIAGLETGADDYLTKPFDKKELQTRVKNLIRQRQQLREKFSKQITLQPRNISITSIDERFLKKVEDIIEARISEEEFGALHMQDALAMSKTQTYRKIKGVTGQSPGEFIRNYRLKRAAQILAQQGDNVTQVAYSVGFNNLSYFAKCFREMYGVSPSEYIRSNAE